MIRKLVIVASTVLAITAIATWIVSYVSSPSWYGGSTMPLGNGLWGGYSLYDGLLVIQAEQSLSRAALPPPGITALPGGGWMIGPGFQSKHDIEWSIGGLQGLRFELQDIWTKRTIFVQLPIPMLVVIFAVYPLAAGPLRQRHRRKRGLCVTCGYNLTGNVSGVCPECGTEVAEP